MNPNSLLFSQREREREREREIEREREREIRRWIIVGQGPIALAVDTGGIYLDIFSLVYLFSFLSPFLGVGSIQTEILSQGGR